MTSGTMYGYLVYIIHNLLNSLSPGLWHKCWWQRSSVKWRPKTKNSDSKGAYQKSKNTALGCSYFCVGHRKWKGEANIFISGHFDSNCSFLFDPVSCISCITLTLLSLLCSCDPWKTFTSICLTHGEWWCWVNVGIISSILACWWLSKFAIFGPDLVGPNLACCLDCTW